MRKRRRNLWLDFILGEIKVCLSIFSCFHDKGFLEHVVSSSVTLLLDPAVSGLAFALKLYEQILILLGAERIQ